MPARARICAPWACVWPWLHSGDDGGGGPDRVLRVALAQWIKPGAGMVGALARPRWLGCRGLGPEPVKPSPFDGATRPRHHCGNPAPSNPAAADYPGGHASPWSVLAIPGRSRHPLQVDREKTAPFLRLLDALLLHRHGIREMGHVPRPLSPFSALMAQLVMRIGLGTVAGMSAYVGTVLLGLALLMLLYLVIVTVVARVQPFTFLKDAAGTLLLAFSTSSSSAIMPMTMSTARIMGTPLGHRQYRGPPSAQP